MHSSFKKNTRNIMSKKPRKLGAVLVTRWLESDFEYVLVARWLELNSEYTHM